MYDLSCLSCSCSTVQLSSIYFVITYLMFLCLSPFKREVFLTSITASSNSFLLCPYQVHTSPSVINALTLWCLIPCYHFPTLSSYARTLSVPTYQANLQYKVRQRNTRKCLICLSPELVFTAWDLHFPQGVVWTVREPSLGTADTGNRAAPSQISQNVSINTEKICLLVPYILTTPLLQQTSNLWKPALPCTMKPVLVAEGRGFLCCRGLGS